MEMFKLAGTSLSPMTREQAASFMLARFKEHEARSPFRLSYTEHKKDGFISFIRAESAQGQVVVYEMEPVVLL